MALDVYSGLFDGGRDAVADRLDAARADSAGAPPAPVVPITQREAGHPQRPVVDTSALEAQLDAVDGQPLHLQYRARQQLTAEGQPLTRSALSSGPSSRSTPHPSNDDPDPTHVEVR